MWSMFFCEIMMLISLFYKFLLEEKEYVQLLNSKALFVSKYAWIKEFCKEWLKQRLFGFW